MNKNDLDEIFDKLINAHDRRKQVALIKANAEIETIQREDTAYFDGAYDAIKEVKRLLEKDSE